MLAKKNKNIYGRGISEYIARPNKEKANALSRKYNRQMHESLRAFKKNNAILYYLVKWFNIENLWTLYNSSMKTTKLLWALSIDLWYYGMPEEWETDIKRQLTMVANRAAYIRKIIAINLRLTDDWCYFRDQGMKELDEILLTDDMDSQLEEILKRSKAYKETHQEEIAAHMKEVQPEIDALNAERQRNAEKQKAEKEARRRERQERDAEVREIKKNREMWQKLSKKSMSEQIEYLAKIRRRNDGDLNREAVQQSLQA